MKRYLIIVGVLACVGANIAKIGHRKAKTKRRLQLFSPTQDGTAGIVFFFISLSHPTKAMESPVTPTPPGYFCDLNGSG